MACYKTSFSVAKISFSFNADKPTHINWFNNGYGKYFCRIEKPDIRVQIVPSLNNVPGDFVSVSKELGLYHHKKGLGSYAAFHKEFLPLGDITRFLASRVIIEKDGLLLHACGIKRGKDTFLFCGPSGAGKTTVAKLAIKPWEVLSDETVAVRKLSDNFQAFSTPFFGDFGKVTKNTGAPLKAIFFLNNARSFGLRQLDLISAVKKLAQGIFLIGNNWQNSMEDALRIAESLARKVPAYELDFLPEVSLWKYLEKKISLGE